MTTTHARSSDLRATLTRPQPFLRRLSTRVLGFLVLMACSPGTDVVTVEELCNKDYGEYYGDNEYIGSRVAIRQRPQVIYACTDQACDESNACCNSCTGFLGYTCPAGSKVAFIELRSNWWVAPSDGGTVDGGTVDGGDTDGGDTDGGDGGQGDGGMESNLPEGYADAGIPWQRPQENQFTCAGNECDITCDTMPGPRHAVSGTVSHLEGKNIVLEGVDLIDRNDSVFQDHSGGCGCGPVYD